jgi:Mrp family chromosome partitioning ATPase
MQERQRLKDLLDRTEADLRVAKTNLGILSLEDAKKAKTEELSKVRQSIFDTEAQLAEKAAALERRLPKKDSTKEIEAPKAEKDEYTRLCRNRELLRRTEEERLGGFTEKSSRVADIRKAIDAIETRLQELEEKYPQLAKLQDLVPKPGASYVDLTAEQANVTALQAKLDLLRTNQLAEVLREIEMLNTADATITELQRSKDLLEKQFIHISSTLEQAKFDQTLGAGKNSNITVAQNPTLPSREDTKLKKILIGILVGGFVLGIGLAFAIEQVFSTSVRRPSEIESRFKLPVFIQIPYMRHARKQRQPLLSAPAAGTGGEHDVGPAPAGGPPAEDLAVAPAKPAAQNGLTLFVDALRDRLITFFEVQGILHKPKLVAVAGCNQGAGVTSVAAGLAASLSETGDGNVLLVDMNSENGSAHPFFKGRPTCGLNDALESTRRNSAMISDNLYAVTGQTNGGNLPRVLPKRFGNLVPRLKASDYDYIIFDMPPVSQTSITPRLAGHMDVVLLVLESEKTSRDAVKRARDLLAESNATVATVFNKAREYLPKWLNPES